MDSLYDFNSSLDWSNPWDAGASNTTDAGNNPGAYDPFQLVGLGMKDYASQNGLDVGGITGSGDAQRDAFNNWFNNNGFGVKNAVGPGNMNYFQGFNGDTPIGKSVGTSLNDPMFDLATSILAGAAGAGLGGLAGFGAIGQGAMSGGLSSMMSTLDPKQGLMGALYGGLGGGLVDKFNPAGSMGIDNQYLQKAVNNGIRGGVVSGLRGGDIGQGALGGALSPLINYGASQVGLMPQGSLPTLGAGGGLDGAPDVGTGSFEFPDGENSVTMGGAPLPSDVMMHMPQSMGGGYTGSETTTSASGENSPTAKIMSALGLDNTPLSGMLPTGNLGDMAKGLMSLYSWNEQRKRLKDQESALGVGQNGAYAKALRQQLNRRDAAAGRRSQYGPREVELQAALAGMASRNAPARAQLAQQRAQLTGQGLAALYSNLNKTGALQKLSDMFMPQQQMSIDPSGYGLTSGNMGLADYGLAGDY